MSTAQETKEQLLSSLQKWTELSGFNVGGKVVFATDEWFAHADNLLSASEPAFDPDAYNPFGKTMDGWESRRRRKAGHDWCIIKLGLPGYIRGVDVNTRWFTGNYTPAFSIQAANLEEDPDLGRPFYGGRDGTAASEEQLSLAAQLKSEEWEEIVSRTNLGPGVPETCHTVCRSSNTQQRYTHIRLNMYPDGGIARLKIFGQVVPDFSKFKEGDALDLLHVKNGGRQIAWSDAHFGVPRNLCSFGRALDMRDGWETARHITRPAILEIDENGRLISPDYDWCILALGHAGTPDEIEVDTNHFKGNFPESVSIEGLPTTAGVDPLTDLTDKDIAGFDSKWKPLLDRVKLKGHKQHHFKLPQDRQFGITHLRVSMYPDGGISRIRVHGTLSG